jgi:hypothetical protein
MFQLMEQSQKLTEAREAREASTTPRQKRNQKFLNHLSTFMEPISDEHWHDFTIEVQTVAHRYARKGAPSAAAGAPLSQAGGVGDNFPQGYAIPYGYGQATYRTGTTPPSFPPLPNIPQGFLASPTNYQQINTPQPMGVSPSGSSTQSSTQMSSQSQSGSGELTDVMNILN